MPTKKSVDKFLYAVINDNVVVNSDKELPLINWDKSDYIFSCVEGNLKGMDVKKGVFTAPRAGFYNITFFCRYTIDKSKKPVVGVSHTKFATFVKYQDQLVNPLGQTCPFSKFKGKYVSASSVSGVIPLAKHEVVAISLYQKNNLGHNAKISAELTITYESSYDKIIDRNVYKDSLRCGTAESGQGDLELYIPNIGFSNYSYANPITPFNSLTVYTETETVNFSPRSFENVEIRYLNTAKITTTNDKLLDLTERGFDPNTGDVVSKLKRISITYGTFDNPIVLTYSDVPVEMY